MIRLASHIDLIVSQKGRDRGLLAQMRAGVRSARAAGQTITDIGVRRAEGGSYLRVYLKSEK